MLEPLILLLEIPSRRLLNHLFGHLIPHIFYFDVGFVLFWKAIKLLDKEIEFVLRGGTRLLVIVDRLPDIFSPTVNNLESFIHCNQGFILSAFSFAILAIFV